MPRSTDRTSQPRQTNASRPTRLSPGRSRGASLVPPAYGLAAVDRFRGAAGPATLPAVQCRAQGDGSGTRVAPRSPGSGGLPDRLRAGVEALSGLAMDDVRVHYNSPEPAQLSALAFTRGSTVHIAPGQERHLPHETWHVVQQKQGRVEATRQLPGGTPGNDDPGLEREAEAMGARAARHGDPVTATGDRPPLQARSAVGTVAQCVPDIRFTNISERPKYAAKAQSIIDALQSAPIVRDYLEGKTTRIMLQDEPRLATITVVRDVTVGDVVKIVLSPWFFEQQSRGCIVGMLAHELGVHDLAKDSMDAAEKQYEDNNQGCWLATGVGSLTIRPDWAKERDHAYATIEGGARFQYYRRTVYQLGCAMLVGGGRRHRSPRHRPDHDLSGGHGHDPRDQRPARTGQGQQEEHGVGVQLCAGALDTVAGFQWTRGPDQSDAQTPDTPGDELVQCAYKGFGPRRTGGAGEGHGQPVRESD